MIFDIETCLIAVLIIFALCSIVYYMREPFANKLDKAQKNYDWFSKHPNPTYTAYQREFADQADIVDYENIAKLVLTNQMTINAIADVI